MLARLTDRLVLCPSRHPLPLENRIQRLVRCGEGQLEVVTMRPQAEREPAAYILKFGGIGSRAERALAHPADFWPHLNAEAWAINYPGYGGSSGRASLRSLACAAQAVYDHVAEIAQGKPILVTGNSLGTAVALHLAARAPVAGMVLRNPPPLRQLIVGRFGWWNLYLGAALIARQVPRDLCSLSNAASATAPAVFLMSGRDRVVPPKYQRQIQEAYGGPKQLILDEEADHATPLAATVEPTYREALAWLHDQVFGRPVTIAESRLLPMSW